MTGFRTAVEALRKPALALMAAACLFAGGAAGGPMEGGAAVQGQAAIDAIGSGPTAILAMGFSGVPAVAGDLAERRQPRTTDGRSGDALDHRTVAMAFRPLTAAAVEAPLSSALARARAGREAAPSTGPPALPF